MSFVQEKPASGSAVCAGCGCPSPEYDVRYLLIESIEDRNTVQRGAYLDTTTKISEKLIGAGRAHFCDQCRKNGNKQIAKVVSIIIFIAGILILWFLMVLIFGYDDASNKPVRIGVAVVLSAAFALAVKSAMNDAPFYDYGKVFIIGLMEKQSDKICIPADLKHYRLEAGKTVISKDLFRSQTDLKTDLALRLMKIVNSGRGNEIVDEFLRKHGKDPETEPVSFCELDSGDDIAFFSAPLKKASEAASAANDAPENAAETDEAPEAAE